MRFPWITRKNFAGLESMQTVLKYSTTKETFDHYGHQNKNLYLKVIIKKKGSLII